MGASTTIISGANRTTDTRIFRTSAVPFRRYQSISYRRVRCINCGAGHNGAEPVHANLTQARTGWSAANDRSVASTRLFKKFIDFVHRVRIRLVPRIDSGALDKRSIHCRDRRQDLPADSFGNVSPITAQSRHHRGCA